MTLGVLLSIGESFAGLRRTGQESRFIKEYLTRYAQSFDRVYVFSYSDEQVQLPPGVVLVPNRFRLHRFLYTLLLPFLPPKEFRSCDVLRIMQAPGALPALIARFFFRIPYVVTYGYEYERLARFEGKRIRAFLLNLMLTPVLKRAAGIIITSRAREQDLRKRGIHNATLIPNGVDPDTFKPMPKAERSSFRILYVGRLEREKNLPLLIEAIGNSKFRDRVELVMVGKGSEETSLRDLAARKHVHLALLGTIPHTELPRHYADADLFTLISVSEGHPKALLEALMTGLPCLVTLPVAAAVGVTDGQEALLTDQTVDDVRVKLETMINEPGLRTRLGVAARAFAKERLDIRETLRKEITLLHHHGRHH